MNQIICDAIINKLIIELRYHEYSRHVEPHAYGRDNNGDEILRCYQVSGGSKSGERMGWKLLKVRDVFSLAITKTKFLPRPNYHRNDKSMQYIFCQL